MNPYEALFLILAPTLLLVALLRKEERILPYLLVYVVTGWILISPGIEWNQQELRKEIEALETPNQELIDQLNNDGGKRAFGLYFGWAYALIYFLGWMIPLRTIPRIIRKRRGEPVGSHNSGGCATSA